MLYPLTFHPLFKTRVWGGRNLERLYQKSLPPGVPIGESWEISDRPGDESRVANGPLAGQSLRWLMEHRLDDLLGAVGVRHSRFPLLVKILDAQEKLSLQVHPPAAIAPRFGGEPKTEMWFIADAAPGAELYVGLRRGVSQVEFERKVGDGSVADCFHRLPVRTGDAMFLPSGRVHAIGAGLVLFEIQQNSDTTYRVFDWNRVGLDGKGRELHLREAIASIDFSDQEPGLLPPLAVEEGPGFIIKHLLRDPPFSCALIESKQGGILPACPGQPRVWGVLRGEVMLRFEDGGLKLSRGNFCLLPATSARVDITAGPQTSILEARPQ